MTADLENSAVATGHHPHTNLWSVATLTFGTNEDNKPCCLQLSYDTHPPSMYPHPTDHYVKEYRTITMLTLSQRSNSEAESVCNF